MQYPEPTMREDQDNNVTDPVTLLRNEFQQDIFHTIGDQGGEIVHFLFGKNKSSLSIHPHENRRFFDFFMNSEIDLKVRRGISVFKTRDEAGSPGIMLVIDNKFKDELRGAEKNEYKRLFNLPANQSIDHKIILSRFKEVERREGSVHFPTVLEAGMLGYSLINGVNFQKQTEGRATAPQDLLPWVDPEQRDDSLLLFSPPAYGRV